MIDFQNGSVFKLKPVKNDVYFEMVSPMFVPGEEIQASFQTVRDGVVFTNKRIISINIQGITGKKKDFTTLPYAKIQVFSVETAGLLDLDSEMDLWFSGLGRVRFEFSGYSNIAGLCKLISGYLL